MLHFVQKTQGYKLPLLAAIGLIFALVAVLTRHTPPKREPIFSPPLSPYTNSVAGIGVIEPKSEIISVATELSGVVRDVPVKVGDMVKEGDPLFVLDQRDISTHIKIQEAALEAAKAAAKEANAQFTLVKGAEDNRSVAKDDYNRRKYNAELMAAKVDEAKAQLAQALMTQERLIVRAPIAGQILNVNVRRGEYAPAGLLTEPLMRIGDITTRHVRVEIDEENALKVSPHSIAKGFKRGDPYQAINLKFVRFEPYVRSKQNLAVAGQRVDTHVLQVIYALEPTDNPPYIGEQMDIYIDMKQGKVS